MMFKPQTNTSPRKLANWPSAISKEERRAAIVIENTWNQVPPITEDGPVDRYSKKRGIHIEPYLQDLFYYPNCGYLGHRRG
jgi:hypothetical protein